jgi:hypothetical protein
MLRAAIVLLGIFFDLATCILLLIGFALLWPGTVVDVIWLLKPDRQLLLMPHRLWLAPMFLLFAIPAAFASYGLLFRKEWGRQLAIVIFAANGIGNIGQIALGHTLEGVIGVAAATALVFLLTRDSVRTQFEHQPATE